MTSPPTNHQALRLPDTSPQPLQVTTPRRSFLFRIDRIPRDEEERITTGKKLAGWISALELAVGGKRSWESPRSYKGTFNWHSRGLLDAVWTQPQEGPASRREAHQTPSHPPPPLTPLPISPIGTSPHLSPLTPLRSCRPLNTPASHPLLPASHRPSCF